jgi:hypothetical protein
MNADDLEREFAPRAVPYTGRLLLLGTDDALALVGRAEQAGIAILGLDAMFLSDRGTESPIEHIADFSATGAKREGCWAAAKAFIEERRRLGMVFEVVLGESNSRVA